MNSLAIQPMEYTPRAVVRQGTCDVCGRWDGHLADGVGGCCRPQPQKAQPYSHQMLPCNALHWDRLTRASAAIFVLDEYRCLVERVEFVGADGVTFHLARAPSAEVAGARFELVRTDGSSKRHVLRMEFMGCTLEWAPNAQAQGKP